MAARVLPRRLQFVCLSHVLAVMLCVIHASPSIAADTDSTVRDRSIGAFLNANGTPDLTRLRLSGYQGVLNFDGFDVSIPQSAGPPRFTQRPNTPSSIATTPGWTPTFTPPGATDQPSQSVAVMAVFGGNLIVGGAFHLGLNDGGTTTISSNIAQWDGIGWKTMSSGVNGTVSSMAIWGSYLVVGGSFSSDQATTVTLSRIGKWDGSAWSSLGSGVSGGNVASLAVLGSKVYVGGNFSSPSSNIASWDGSSWATVGGGISGTVLALAVFGSDLYAGGGFTGNIVRSTSGTGTWTIVGGGASGTSSQVNALTVWSTYLVVGGSFTAVGSPPTTATHVAGWDGSSWNVLGSLGAGGTEVTSLGVSYTGALVAGGTFSGHVATYVASSWSTLGGGLDDKVLAFSAYGGELIVGGAFLNANSPSKPLQRLGRWDGSNWKQFGKGLTNTYIVGSSTVIGAVRSMAVASGILYAGGYFDDAAGSPAHKVAAWDGSDWTALGSGIAAGGAYAAGVHAVAVYSGNIVVAGIFENAGGSAASRIASWNGSTWSTLGTAPNDGLNGTAYALVVQGSDLYVGGSFTANGGSGATTLRGIAKWSGSTWSEPNNGITGTVYALATDGTTLYAGGSFSAAGGTSAANVAKYIGAAWSAMGTGTDGPVRALAIYQSQVYAGGDFTHVNGSGTAALHLGRWDGSGWNDLDGGVSGGSGQTVNALTTYHGRLVVGGAFTTAGTGGGSVTANNVARWRTSGTCGSCASTWDSFGTGSSNGVGDGVVYSLAVVSDKLYVGGTQRTTDGYIVNNLSLYEETAPDLTPPSTVSSLTLGRGTHTVTASWSESGDDGASGTPTSFDLRYSKSNIITDCDFVGATQFGPPGGWTPQTAGGGECITIDGMDACSTYYFAVKIVDEACNWSALSNVPHLTTRCASLIEVDCGNGNRGEDELISPPLELNAATPNPVRSGFKVSFTVPSSMVGTEYDLALYDVAGRRLGLLGHGIAVLGSQVVESSLAQLPEAIPSGVYFTRLRIGATILSRVAIVVR